MFEGRRHRRLNPSTTTWILIGGAIAIVAGGVTYAVLRRRPTSLGDPVRIPHAGLPGHSWPRQDLFPDASAFGDALEQMGYEVGQWSTTTWSLLDGEVQAAIRAFQEDYNAVRKTIEQPPTHELEVSGLLDDPTVTALAYVASLQDLGESWPVIVYTTRQAGIT